MKNTNFKFSFIAMCLLTHACLSCKSVDVTPVYAEWTVKGLDHITSYHSARTGNQFESDCDNNNKMWVKIGSIPTQTNNRYVVVGFLKQSYGPNEIGVDVAHGDEDYLSTGKVGDSAKVYLVNGQVQMFFDSLTVVNTKTNANTTLDGYLDEE